MPRYSATFTFDASDFQSARELARDMRAALRDDSRSYADANTKLVKLVDPYAGDEVEDAQPDF